MIDPVQTAEWIAGDKGCAGSGARKHHRKNERLQRFILQFALSRRPGRRLQR